MRDISTLLALRTIIHFSIFYYTKTVDSGLGIPLATSTTVNNCYLFTLCISVVLTYKLWN